MDVKFDKLVSSETGEVLDVGRGKVAIIVDDMTSAEVANRTINHRRYKKERTNLSKINFIACYDGKVAQVANKLSNISAGMWMVLLSYMDRDGALVNDNSPMTVEDIAKVLGKGRPYTNTLLKEFKTVGLLMDGPKLGRKSTFMVNEDYHARRSLSDRHFSKLWLMNLRNYSTKISHADLGVLFKLMPWFNTFNQRLCRNPYEYEPLKAEYLTVEDIAEMVGVSKANIYRTMSSLKNSGIVADFNTYGHKAIILNPLMVYRGVLEEGEEPAPELQHLFIDNYEISKI